MLPPMAGISTHVLDAALGRPAEGIAVRLTAPDGETSTGVTDSDGRIGDLYVGALRAGVYTLVFAVAGEFYPEITIAFVADPARGHYHVPLLLSPYGYTTYRGS
jgi:5-hydroxyisourate hydrolase